MSYYPPSPPSGFPPLGPPPPRRRRPVLIWLGIVAAVVVVMCGAVAIGAVLSSSNAPQAWEGRSLATGTPVAPGPLAATTPLPLAARPSPTGPASSFGDGTYQVGVDIRPGTYRTVVPGDSLGCYWARLKNATGGLDAIITNNNVNAGGHITVTIKSSDGAFQTEDCGTWVRTG